MNDYNKDYRTIKYTNCHLGFLKCEDCAFKGNCKERFNYQCLANHQSEYIPLYGTDDKNYHFVLCEKDEFEKLDEKDKAGFISYLTDDEAPMAYKPMKSIINSIRDTVSIIKQIKPLYNFKANE